MPLSQAPNLYTWCRESEIPLSAAHKGQDGPIVWEYNNIKKYILKCYNIKYYYIILLYY